MQTQTKQRDEILLTTRRLCEQYASVMENLQLEIRNLLEGKGKIEFEDSIEDEANNDLHSVDSENVYFNTDDSYPIEELGFWDGIYILEALSTHQ